MKRSTKAALTVAAATASVGAVGVAAMAPRLGFPGWEHFAGHRFAHRGLHNLSEWRPENSLSAFRAAVEHGFGAELDVHLMRDGALCVVHDSDLARVTGRSAVVEELAAADLADFPLLGSGETIPLFEKVLRVFSGKTPLIIELKTHAGNSRELVRAVMERMDRYNGPYCLESFDPHVLWWLKRDYPDVIRGQLSENFVRSAPAHLSPAQRFALTHLLTTPLTQPDFVAYNHIDRDAPALRMMRRLYNVHEVSWTVRDPNRLRELEANGCVVIFEGFVPE